MDPNPLVKFIVGSPHQEQYKHKSVDTSRESSCNPVTFWTGWRPYWKKRECGFCSWHLLGFSLLHSTSRNSVLVLLSAIWVGFPFRLLKRQLCILFFRKSIDSTYLVPIPIQVLPAGGCRFKWNQSGIQVGSNWDPIRIQLGSNWDPIGIQLGSNWDPSGISVGFKWYSSGIQVGSKLKSCWKKISRYHIILWVSKQQGKPSVHRILVPYYCQLVPVSLGTAYSTGTGVTIVVINLSCDIFG
jgi:hypothetical protein